MSIRPLPNELQAKANCEINEITSRIEKDIQYIRYWLSQQDHLISRTEDQWILGFLRGCKFNLQKTKEKLDKFYTMKSLMPELYTNRDPLLPEVHDILKLGLVLPLLETDGTAGPRVIIVRCEPIDPSKILFVNIIKVAVMVIDILLNEDDNFIIAGQHGLLDFKGTKMSHIFQMNLSIVKNLAFIMQRAYPTRPKGFHGIHTSSLVQIILNIVKPLLSEKLRKRIHVYSSTADNSLYQHISPTILPKDYGGSGASLSELTNYWVTKVESYRDWFLEDERYGSDETKRRTSGTIVGAQQSFIKLSID